MAILLNLVKSTRSPLRFDVVKPEVKAGEGLLYVFDSK